MKNNIGFKMRVVYLLLFSLLTLDVLAQEQEPDESGIGGTGRESPISLDDAIFSRPELPEINEAPEIQELTSPVDIIEDLGEMTTTDDTLPSVGDTIE